LTISEVDVFDFNSGRWETLDSELPTERAGSTSVVFDEKLLVIGGESGTQVPAHSEVEVWDTDTKSWKSWPSLEQGRHGTQAFIFEDAIYVAAGSGNRGGGPELTSMEKFVVE
jgi:N-acetylneuraminic acid mutarotase